MKYIDKYVKCKENYLYFLSHLGITLDEQQKDYLNTVHNDKFTILLAPRQSGKDYTTLPYLLWYALFHSNKNIVIVGHSFEKTKILLKRIDIMIEKFTNHYSEKFISLFPNINNFHKTRIDFSNGSKIRINDGNSSKGITIDDDTIDDDIDILYLSELAFHSKVENLVLSSYPFIAKRQNYKIIIASSVNSKYDEFYIQWSKALERRSRFTPVRWHFENVNHFSKEFKDETIKSIGQERWGTEFECNFN